MHFQKLMDNFLLHYLNHFDKHCFNVKLHDQVYTIGQGEPEFTVIVHKDIPKAELLESTELALGEAYMRGDIEIQGDLFHMLCTFLSRQIASRSTARGCAASSTCRKRKRTRPKRSRPIMI